MPSLVVLVMVAVMLIIVALVVLLVVASVAPIFRTSPPRPNDRCETNHRTAEVVSPGLHVPATAFRILVLASGVSKFPNSQSHITVGDLQLTYNLHSIISTAGPSPTPTNTSPTYPFLGPSDRPWSPTSRFSAPDRFGGPSDTVLENTALEMATEHFSRNPRQ
jgi:hypothetical protein